MTREQVSAWNELRPLFTFPVFLTNQSVYRLQSREWHYKEKEVYFLLHVVPYYLVLGSDRGEFLVPCCNIVVTRGISKTPSRVLKYFESNLAPSGCAHLISNYRR